MTRLKILLSLSGVLFIMISLLNSCASKMPAQQQRNITIPKAPIAVSAVDTNNNGIIEVEEMEKALPHTQDSQISTLGAFGAIAGSVLVLCLGCVWLTNNVPETNTKSSLLDKPEDSEELTPEEEQLLQETALLDEDEWCHADQDFEKGKRG